MTKAQSLRADFARAITRLDEALALPSDPIVPDSAIQRFEISFELCWRFLNPHSPDKGTILRGLAANSGLKFRRLRGIERGSDGGPDG